MKYLRIQKNKGQYWDGNDYQDIDKINKEDLLSLLNWAEKKDFEMDSYDETLMANKAHQIIYENIYKKIEQFVADKEVFKKAADELYKDAINKYSVNIEEEIEEENPGGDDL